MILEITSRRRRVFDISSKKDLDAARYFFKTHSWRSEMGCPFILEYPFESVPDMIRHKLVHKHLGIDYDPRHHSL